MTRDLGTRLSRLGDMSGTPLRDLFDGDRFDELVELLEELPPGAIGEEPAALVHAVRDHRKRKLQQYGRAMKAQLDLGEIVRAEALLEKIRRTGGELPEVALLTGHFTRARSRHRVAEEARAQLAEARALSGEQSFLPEMRDGRAVYQSLLDRIEIVGQHVDAEQISRELKLLERRIREREARMSVVGTNAALDELGPNLEALRELEEMAERGETEVAMSGAELTPIVTAIQDLQIRVRPKLGRLIGRHVEDARRLYEDRGDPRAALTRLIRQRDAWRYLDEHLLDKVETLEAELAAHLERRARLEDAVERVVGLVEAEKFREAARLLDVELARIEDVPRELAALGEVVRRQWLTPIVKKVRKWTGRVRRLAILRPERVEQLLEQLEGLADELPDSSGPDDEVHALGAEIDDALAFLERLEEVIELQQEGRLEQAAALLGRFGETHPQFARAIGQLVEELGAERTKEETLADLRALYREDPEAAIEQARAHVGRDVRFVRFIDFAVIEGALAEARAAELDGRYADAIAHIEQARRDRKSVV